MVIARTARATLTKSSPVLLWLCYFEKCSKLIIFFLFSGAHEFFLFLMVNQALPFVLTKQNEADKHL